MDDLLGPLAADKLHKFLECAVKKAASECGHVQRWNEFVVEAHLSGWQLSAEQLSHWLNEQGLPAHTVSQLTFEYTFARGLLEAYDAKLNET